MRTRLLSLASATLVLGLSAPTVAQAIPPAGTHSVQAERQRAAQPPSRAVLFGLDDHWENDIISDDRQDGAKSGIVGTFLPWSKPGVSASAEATMVVHYAEWAHSRGSIPMVDLHPPTGVSLASIAAGSQDSVLAAYAQALRDWNHPFLFRLFPEMNLPGKDYAPGYRGQTAGQFIAAWRHVYTLFRHYGATKVQFIWNPDKLLTHQKLSFFKLWPGNNYVDWVGLDVYQGGPNAKGFYPSAQLITTQSVNLIRRFTSKPLMIPEVGVANFPNKPHWIATALTGLAALGAKSVVWFNEDVSQANWRLDSSSAALRSARQTLSGTAVVWPGHNGGDLTRDQALVSKGTW